MGAHDVSKGRIEAILLEAEKKYFVLLNLGGDLSVDVAAGLLLV